MLYDVKTEKWRQLNTTPDFFGYLAWSQDSAYVYFDTVLKGDNGYFRLRVSDSKLEKVADLKKVRQFRGQFGPGSWTGLAPARFRWFPATSAPRRFTPSICSFLRFRYEL
jgi:hypothetical protein